MSHKKYLVLSPEQLRRLRGDPGPTDRLDTERKKQLARAAKNPSYEDYLKYQKAFTQYLNLARTDAEAPLSLAIQSDAPLPEPPPPATPTAPPLPPPPPRKKRGPRDALNTEDPLSTPKRKPVSRSRSQSRTRAENPPDKRTSRRPHTKATQSSPSLLQSIGSWLPYRS